MDIRYYYDPESGQPHIYGHGVAEHEVEEVLTTALEDRAGSQGSRVAIGRTEGGRFLKVVYVPAVDEVFVVTAFDLGQRPARH